MYVNMYNKNITPEIKSTYTELHTACIF